MSEKADGRVLCQGPRLMHEHPFHRHPQDIRRKLDRSARTSGACPGVTLQLGMDRGRFAVCVIVGNLAMNGTPKSFGASELVFLNIYLLSWFF